MQQGSGTAFMITEKFLWPDRGATVEEQQEVLNRTLKGFQHRQKYVDAGKAYWFARVDSDVGGIFILRGSFEELQEFFQTDPFYGIIQREVVSLHDAARFASHFEEASRKANLGDRVASPLVTGSLTLGNLTEALRERLMGTDTNY